MNLLHPRTAVLVCLSCLLASVAGAQDVDAAREAAARKEYPTETLYALWRAYAEDPASLDAFYDALPDRHLVETDPDAPGMATVTYVAKGSGETDYLLQAGGPDFYGLRFRQIGDSPYYVCTQRIPSDAWFTYGVNEFKRMPVPDGGGLFQTSMAHVHDGVVIGPDAPLSEHVRAAPAVPAGTLHEATLTSDALGEARRLIVYTPPGFDGTGAHHLVVQLDGQQFARDPDHGPAWQGWTPMPTILDNLHRRNEIAPTIAVLVPNQGNRSEDLLSEAFTDFIAREVIPWARSRYPIGDASRVVVSGPSRAAFAALRTALRHPEAVDGVLSQSGSFYYTLGEEENWPVYPKFEGRLLADVKNGPTLPVDVYLEVGLYDLGLGRVGVNRQLRDVLELKGYRVRYREYAGGHAHLNWRHTLPGALTYFFGPTSAHAPE